MKRGQVFVRARDVNGKWYSADVLDLDDASFRAFVVGQLHRAGLVFGLIDSAVEEPHIEMHSTVAAKE